MVNYICPAENIMSQHTAAPAPPTMALHSDAHKDTILSKLDKLRKRDVLCDITLVVGDARFKAHKALLAASSDFFSLMFTSEDQASQSVYELDGMEAKTFDAVLEFIYSARVSPADESATEQLLAMARLLEVDDLVKTLDDHRAWRPAVGRTGEEVNPDGTGDASTHPKRKRGRPRKNVDGSAKGSAGDEASKEKASRVGGRQLENEPRVVADHATVSGIDPEDPGTEPQQSKDSDDADYVPRAARSRQSKRKIKPPVKFKGFRVGDDVAERREPGKRGRNRKYPNTEPRCEDCGKVFKNHLFLKIHRRTHTGEKPFRCPVCGKGFSQKHTLLVHQRMHTGEKPFVCTVCSKALSTKNSLLEHMNLHTEQKSFSCDKCGKNFSQKRQLKSHYRVHTGKSLSECSLCHHKFMDAAQLKKHLRTHTGEKPFTCEICGNCFTAKSTLQTHIRIHRGEKPYTCNVCNKAFSDASARRRHVASHSGKKPFTCSSCGLTFARLDNLKTHAKTHSKERLAPPPEAPPPEAALLEEAGAARAGEEEEEEEEEEEVRGILQLQPYPLPAHPGQQEIQLVVTGDVGDISFVPSGHQEAGVSIIATATGCGSTAGHAHPGGGGGLALLTQPSGHVQNVALVAQGGVAEPQIQTISVLEGPMASGGGGAEQMHVITLSKEAMEHLQAHHGPPLQIPHHGPPQPLQIPPHGPPQPLQIPHHGPPQPLQIPHHGPPQPPQIPPHGPPQPQQMAPQRPGQQLHVMHHQPPAPLQLAGPPLGHMGRGPQGQVGGGPQGQVGGGPQGHVSGGPQGQVGGGPQGQVGRGPQGQVGGGPQGQVGGGPQGQAIRINSQSSQPIAISQTAEQIPGHHIQGQTFQIQAGTVSYLYTTTAGPAPHH